MLSHSASVVLSDAGQHHRPPVGKFGDEGEVPDPGFAHEVEPGAMDYGGTLVLRISAEEDVAPKIRWKAATSRRYCEPPCWMPKVSSISAALSNVIRGVC